MLEVRPPTPSDEQGISSEGHAVIIQDEGDAARGVARAGPDLQGLPGRKSTDSHQEANGSVLRVKLTPGAPTPPQGHL